MLKGWNFERNAQGTNAQGTVEATECWRFQWKQRWTRALNERLGFEEGGRHKEKGTNGEISGNLKIGVWRLWFKMVWRPFKIS